MKMRFIYSVIIVVVLSGWCRAQCWKAVESGWNHTLAIKKDGTLWGWGYNLYGQLGDNSTQRRLSPVQIGSDTDWKAVSCQTALYGDHSIGLKSNGTLWSWGSNKYSQLGRPVALGLDSIPGQVGNEVDWKMVSAGFGYNLALKNNGTIWGWGSNKDGRLGLDSIVEMPYPAQIGTDTSWVFTSAGDYHSLAIKKNGTLWTWGYNLYGQLGDSTKTTRFVPVQIGTDTTWKFLSGGNSHSLGIKSDGTLWIWGDGGDGIKPLVPTQIGTDTNWVYASAGNDHSFFIKQDSSLWVMGSQGPVLGLGTSLQGKSSPFQIATSSKWLTVSSRFNHTMAIKSNGNLYACGDNYEGQLGIGAIGGADNTKNTLTLINCTPVGLEEIVSETGSFSIFPNPSINELTINVSQQSEMFIYSIDGRKVMQMKINPGTKQIQHYLAPGIYIVEVRGKLKSEKVRFSVVE